MYKRKTTKAALTIEAALVFPIFIFAVIAFLSLFQIVLIQGRIQWALMETSLEASRYAYVYQDLMGEERAEKEKTRASYQNVMNRLEDGVFLQQCFQKYMKDEAGNWLYNKDFLTGGISLLQSEFLQDGENVDVVVSYQITLPLGLIPKKTYTFAQRSRVRGFVGTTRFGEGIKGIKGKDDDKDIIVYITETGTVYHKWKECTHLKLSITNVVFSQVEHLRNGNGGKYHACEKCVKTPDLGQGTMVFVAKEGDRYHCNKNCSGLKRTVQEIKLSEVNGRRPCSRCGN